MSKSFCLLLFFFFFKTSFSQSWCMPGAVWNYTAGFNPNSSYQLRGYTEIRYTGDELVDGRLCNKLSYASFRTVGPPGYPCCAPVHKSLYTYLEDSVIYFRIGNNVFDTLANFNSPLWKGWTIDFYDSITCSNPYPGVQKFSVIDTGHAIINGANLKYLLVCRGDSAFAATFSATASYRIYERIGPTSGFIMPYSWGCTEVVDIWPYEGEFTCYWDDTFPIYKNSQFNICNYNTIGLNYAFQDELAVYPNPSNGKVHISTEQPMFFEIFAMDGRTLKRGGTDIGTDEIDLSDLNDGSYFIRLTNGKSSAVRIINILRH